MGYGHCSGLSRNVRIKEESVSSCLICGIALPRELEEFGLCSKHLDTLDGFAVTDTMEAPDVWLPEFEMEEE